MDDLSVWRKDLQMMKIEFEMLKAESLGTDKIKEMTLKKKSESVREGDGGHAGAPWQDKVR